MHIAYLINQYPKISHTFIRREIAALEAQGIAIQPFSIRRMNESVLDPADQAEAERTIALLAHSPLRFGLAFVRRLVTQPIGLARALGAAIWMGLHSPRGLAGHLAYFFEACLLVDLMKPYSHLHVHFGTNPAALATLCRKMGGPAYSLTVHGPAEFDDINSLFLAEKVNDAIFTIVECSYSRAQLMRLVPPDRWDRLHLIRCAMNTAYGDAPPVPVSGQRQMVCVARLEMDKGLLILIEALGSLPPDARPDSVVIVGDGSQRARLEQRIVEAGLADLIRLVGWADEAQIRGHIVDSDVVILPSLAENLPVTLIDAFALGRPVIATWLAGIPELVRHEVNGWLVPAGDPAALAQAIKAAMATPPPHLNKMGCAGREQVHQQHNSQIESAKLAALFRGLE